MNIPSSMPSPAMIRLRDMWRLVTLNRKVSVGLVILLFFVLLAIFGPLFFPQDPNAFSPSRLQPPTTVHWLGTTQTGQDILAQVVVGTRVSVIMGFAIGIMTMTISIIIGLAAGYFGGWIDEVLSLLSNIFLVLPTLPLAILLAAFAAYKGPLTLIIVLTVTGWSWGARVLRAQTLSLRNRECVEAARASGEPALQIIFFEILPNEIAIVAAQLLGTVIYAILAETGLEFLGLGDVTGASWGTMLYWAANNDALLLGAWWWFLAPGLCIAVLGAGLAFINFGIDEIANPRLRSEPGSIPGKPKKRRNVAEIPNTSFTAPPAVRYESMPDALNIQPSRTSTALITRNETKTRNAAVSPPSATSVILEAVHLRKYFPVHRFKLFSPPSVVHAVEDTSLALRPGRALALVGESGSGKTTVARMLARLYEPTAGTIKFRGDAVNVHSGANLHAYRRHVQLVFQDPFSSLNLVHTVRYHLKRPLQLYGHARTPTEETEQVLALLNRVSLSPAEQFIQKYPHQLSGGQRQRVAIARSLAARPEVLLADEPVSMLDVSIRLDILNLLLRLKDEEHLALLFITHDIASARYFAEDTLVMYAGQSVEGGPSEEVIQHPRHPYTQLLISAAPDPNRRGIDGKSKVALHARGEIPSLISPPGGCRFHPRCPHAMPVCSQRFPTRTELGGGHWTHCFLYEGGKSGQQAVQKEDISV